VYLMFGCKGGILKLVRAFYQLFKAKCSFCYKMFDTSNMSEAVFMEIKIQFRSH